MTTLGYGTNPRRNVPITINMFKFMVCDTCLESMQFCATGARGKDHPPFSNFLLTNLLSIKFLQDFISLLFHLFFIILTCPCQYSYNLMLTSNCMCRSYYIIIIHKACNSAGLKIVPLLASSTFIAPYFHYVIQTRTCIHS